MRTNDNLFYAPRRLRGLGLMKASSTVDDQLFQSVSNCTEELESCVAASGVNGNSTKSLRTALRQKSYEDWYDLKYQGAGAIHFQTFVKGNDFVCNKNTL